MTEQETLNQEIETQLNEAIQHLFSLVPNCIVIGTRNVSNETIHQITAHTGDINEVMEYFGMSVDEGKASNELAAALFDLTPPSSNRLIRWARAILDKIDPPQAIRIGATPNDSEGTADSLGREALPKDLKNLHQERERGYLQ